MGEIERKRKVEREMKLKRGKKLKRQKKKGFSETEKERYKGSGSAYTEFYRLNIIEH